jgi:hypothetical protein
MTLDKELYRKTYAAYREWSEAKHRAMIQEAVALTSAERWARYESMWEFGWPIYCQQAPTARQKKLKHTQQYYNRIRKLEAWRRARGRAS